MATSSVRLNIFILPVIIFMVLSHGVFAGNSSPEPVEPITLGVGPHLFLDTYLIDSSSYVVRRIMPPRREPANPLINSEEDGNKQPYVTVLRDPETSLFRIWYMRGYMESKDGVHWIRPRRALNFPFPIKIGASILDEGPDYQQKEKRFKFAYYHDGKLRLAVSPDGLEWKSHSPEVMVPSGDISNIYWDSSRNRYGVNLKKYGKKRDWLGHPLRANLQSTSNDLVNWSEPRVIIEQDECDHPETQFYCMGGVLERGDLLIGMVRILREDLPAEPHWDVLGIGYTTLAWSRDGENWIRDREPFLDRSARSGTWDRAMAWVDCQLPVGDEVYFYYGGYRFGHKGNLSGVRDRQIGLARMTRDRYVARETNTHHIQVRGLGRLLTPPLILEGARMTLNVNAGRGEILVQVLDMNGESIHGFTFADCEPVTKDSIEAPVKWKRQLSELKGVPVRLEFQMRQTVQLFAFNLHDDF